MRSNSSIHGVSGIMDGLAAADRFIGNRKNDELRDRQMGLQEAAYARDEERHNAQMDEHRSQMEVQDAAKLDAFGQLAARYAMILEGMDAGDLSPEQKELVDKHPTLSPEFINSPEAAKAIDTYEAVKSGKLRFDSPEAIEAINIVSPEVNLGAGDGRKRRVKNIVPGQQPGEFYFGLEVEGDPQERPLTVRRSSDPDDPVKAVKVEDLIGKFEGLKQYRMLLNSKKGRQALIHAYSPGAKGGKAATVYGPIVTDKTTGMKGQYDSTGKFHPVDQRKRGSSGSGSGGGKLPNEAQMIEYLQTKFKGEGKELSTEQAYAMIKLAASDPTRYVNDYVQRMMEQQQYDDDKQTSQELQQEAMKSYEEIRQYFSKGSSSGGVTGAGAGGKTDPGTETPQDPDAFLDEFL